jgi:hypothetical protein
MVVSASICMPSMMARKSARRRAKRAVASSSSRATASSSVSPALAAGASAGEAGKIASIRARQPSSRRSLRFIGAGSSAMSSTSRQKA